ncbi:unnamed protein product [Lymnaea stagnalis]|uniref:Uncharacterized protein n=1 Tax=Lymnaea stagnalis TaxID=6523 RepID=A0AAV2IHF0_LYMST
MVNDFVRMLWEQKVEKLVMLTNLTEEGKMKCERYWPEEGSRMFGRITITLTTTQIFADYTIRRLQLIKNGQGSQHITQYHFTSWPDKGVPLTPWGLVDFEQRVFDQPSIQPVVVHCSAGVGRTGTFIALRNIMRQAEDTGHVDFFNTVAKLRQARTMMVQTHVQYQFLHRAALVAIACMGTTITNADIEKRIAILEMNFGTGKSQLEKEFEAVCTISKDVGGTDSEREHNDDVIYQNSAGDKEVKDRSSSVKPRELYRATLKTDTTNTGDYINAVLVPSFTKPNNFILTQIPLTTTVVDFWRLVTQYEVKLVLAFELDSSDNKTFGNYLPLNHHEPLELQQFIIETEESDGKGFYEEQRVTVKRKKDKNIKMFNKNSFHALIHLKCSIRDYDLRNLLTVITQARGIIAKQKGRVVFVCRNGATYSGLACVLTILLDRMDNDLRLTVPLVVGAVKSIRPEAIPTVDQYRLLYQTLQRYNETSAFYTNFTAKPPAGQV